MAKEKMKAPAFDDIVFEDRNKEYGAYKLRKKYSRTMIICTFYWNCHNMQLLLLLRILMQKRWKTDSNVKKDR